MRYPPIAAMKGGEFAVDGHLDCAQLSVRVEEGVEWIV